jgi:two-component system, NarL family, sensor kinase
VNRGAACPVEIGDVAGRGDVASSTAERRLVLRGPVARAVGIFTGAGLVVLVGVIVAANLASRRAGAEAAIREARLDATVLARTAISPTLTNSVVAGGPAAVAALNREVRSRVLDGNLVRVKLWRSDGTIVYSDASQLIGKTYDLEPDERQALQDGFAAADVSDLTRPENRFERPFGKLLEVYQPVRTPDRTPLLFEAYFRYDSVIAGGRRAWSDFAPVVLVALIVLEAFQVPLAWSMARRLRTGQLRQERLLTRAIEASDAERRRIARDLHDGVVQDLASVSYTLAALDGELTGTHREALDDAAASTRRSIRALRTLLVEIYPPNLRASGLGAALSDLTAPLAAHGVAGRLDVQPDIVIAPDNEALLFRAAQEAIRNAVAYASAAGVDVSLGETAGWVSLEVSDDGVGFDTSQLQQPPVAGHIGLRLLHDLVSDAGGVMTVRSGAGEGTRMTVQLPAR